MKNKTMWSIVSSVWQQIHTVLPTVVSCELPGANAYILKQN